MKLVNVEEMKRIEQATDAGGHSYAAMMEQAGYNVANIAMALHLVKPQECVLLMIGPGNNGGDGLVAARYLRDAGHDVTLYIWKRDVKRDENFRLLKRRRRGIAILWADNDDGFTKLREELHRAALVVDALFGTGTVRPIEGRLAELLHVIKDAIVARRTSADGEGLPPALDIPRFPLMEAQSFGFHLPPTPPDTFDADDEVNEEDFDLASPPHSGWEEDEPRSPWPILPVIAVDCPSGLNCDSGALDPAAIPADVTVTFAFPKWGHVQYPGAGACGLLSVVSIGVQAELADSCLVELIGPDFVRKWLPSRPADAHKGTFGRIMIVAGSVNYPGAALLSSMAAGRAGAGLVTLAVPSALHPVLSGALPEATWLPVSGDERTHSAAGVPQLLAGLTGYDVLLVGPGLTTSDDAQAFVFDLTSLGGLPREAWRGRTVFDADALNIVASLSDGPRRLPPHSILTPHPGEMARLIGATAAEVNAQRIQTARRWAVDWGHIVLLKGPHTVIAAPDGRVAVLPFALPTLATAGSGDVLAGAIAAVLAQGLPAFEAAIVGAYLHGHAGLRVGRLDGMSGVLASDIAKQFPHALRDLYMIHRQ